MKPLDRIRTIRAMKASAREKLILYDLQGRANASDQCWPGMATVARDTGLSLSTVLRTIKSLQRGGLISYRKTGRQHVYMLTLGNAAMCHSDVSDVSQGRTKIKGKMLRQNPQSSKWCKFHPTVRAKPEHPGLCSACWASETPWTYNYGSPDFKPDGKLN